MLQHLKNKNLVHLRSLCLKFHTCTTTELPGKLSSRKCFQISALYNRRSSVCVSSDILTGSLSYSPRVAVQRTPDRQRVVSWSKTAKAEYQYRSPFFENTHVCSSMVSDKGGAQDNKERSTKHDDGLQERNLDRSQRDRVTVYRVDTDNRTSNEIMRC